MMNDTRKGSVIGGVCGGPIAPERAPEVQSAIQSLMNTAERLNGIAERLGNSLTPVLRSEPQAAGGTRPSDKAFIDVPMANRLNEIDAMCQRAEDILNDVHRRLEV